MGCWWLALLGRRSLVRAAELLGRSAWGSVPSANGGARQVTVIANPSFEEKADAGVVLVSAAGLGRRDRESHRLPRVSCRRAVRPLCVSHFDFVGFFGDVPLRGA